MSSYKMSPGVSQLFGSKDPSAVPDQELRGCETLLLSCSTDAQRIDHARQLAHYEELYKTAEEHMRYNAETLVLRKLYAYHYLAHKSYGFSSVTPEYPTPEIEKLDCWTLLLRNDGVIYPVCVDGGGMYTTVRLSGEIEFAGHVGDVLHNAQTRLVHSNKLVVGTPCNKLRIAGNPYVRQMGLRLGEQETDTTFRYLSEYFFPIGGPGAYAGFWQLSFMFFQRKPSRSHRFTLVVTEDATRLFLPTGGSMALTESLGFMETLIKLID